MLFLPEPSQFTLDKANLTVLCAGVKCPLKVGIPYCPGLNYTWQTNFGYKILPVFLAEWVGIINSPLIVTYITSLKSPIW